MSINRCSVTAKEWLGLIIVSFIQQYQKSESCHQVDLYGLILIFTHKTIACFLSFNALFQPDKSYWRPVL